MPQDLLTFDRRFTISQADLRLIAAATPAYNRAEQVLMLNDINYTDLSTDIVRALEKYKCKVTRVMEAEGFREVGWRLRHQPLLNPGHWHADTKQYDLRVNLRIPCDGESVSYMSVRPKAGGRSRTPTTYPVQAGHVSLSCLEKYLRAQLLHRVTRCILQICWVLPVEKTPYHRVLLACMACRLDSNRTSSALFDIYA